MQLLQRRQKKDTRIDCLFIMKENHDEQEYGAFFFYFFMSFASPAEGGNTWKKSTRNESTKEIHKCILTTIAYTFLSWKVTATRNEKNRRQRIYTGQGRQKQAQTYSCLIEKKKKRKRDLKQLKDRDSSPFIHVIIIRNRKKSRTDEYHGKYIIGSVVREDETSLIQV